MTNPTLTPQAMEMFIELAEKAERDLARLPESCQPVWFREWNRI